eukprot:4032685-Amphidinium_carterae.1
MNRSASLKETSTIHPDTGGKAVTRLNRQLGRLRLRNVAKLSGRQMFVKELADKKRQKNKDLKYRSKTKVLSWNTVFAMHGEEWHKLNSAKRQSFVRRARDQQVIEQEQLDEQTEELQTRIAIHTARNAELGTKQRPPMSHTACRLSPSALQGMRSFVPAVVPQKTGEKQAKHMLSVCPPPLNAARIKQYIAVPDLCATDGPQTCGIVQRLARQRERCLNSVLLVEYNGDSYSYYIALALQRPMHVHLLALDRRQHLPLDAITDSGGGMLSGVRKNTGVVIRKLPSEQTRPRKVAVVDPDWVAASAARMHGRDSASSAVLGDSSESDEDMSSDLEEALHDMYEDARAAVTSGASGTSAMHEGLDDVWSDFFSWQVLAGEWQIERTGRMVYGSRVDVKSGTELHNFVSTHLGAKSASFEDNRFGEKASHLLSRLWAQRVVELNDAWQDLSEPVILGVLTGAARTRAEHCREEAKKEMSMSTKVHWSNFYSDNGKEIKRKALTARARPTSQLSLDESVSNAIYDHFIRKGWTGEQVDAAKNKDGKSLRDFVKEALSKRKGGE